MSIVEPTTVIVRGTADVAKFSLAELSFDGESPLDRAARDVLNEAGREAIAAFGNAPRA